MRVIIASGHSVPKIEPVRPPHGFYEEHSATAPDAFDRFDFDLTRDEGVAGSSHAAEDDTPDAGTAADTKGKGKAKARGKGKGKRSRAETDDGNDEEMDIEYV